MKDRPLGVTVLSVLGLGYGLTFGVRNGIRLLSLAAYGSVTGWWNPLLTLSGLLVLLDTAAAGLYLVGAVGLWLRRSWGWHVSYFLLLSTATWGVVERAYLSSGVSVLIVLYLARPSVRESFGVSKESALGATVVWTALTGVFWLGLNLAF